MIQSANTLGLRENWKQFTLLVIVNTFVGGMVGLERSILPEIAEQEFGIAARTAILSFITAFGLVKALTNYAAGALANRFGRKRLLVAGWVFAIPVPFLLMFAQEWSWVIVANVFLGVNQGLSWSSTVVMKIDLVGERQRGFAMGLNEFAGYLAVAGVAFLTGWIATEQGIRPYPFLIGIALVVAGLLSSIVLVRDTAHHVKAESLNHTGSRLTNLFKDTTWKDPTLGAVTQAGLVNNLNDGLAWGIFPLLLAARGYSLEDIGVVTAVYPAVWGLGQLITGKIADYIEKKALLFVGMAVQGVALILFAYASTLAGFIALSALLGWGTAMVYPTFLASIAERTHPLDRAESIGVFRLWRDLGYPIGAVLAGVLADVFTMETSILWVGVLTLASAIVIGVRMKG